MRCAIIYKMNYLVVSNSNGVNSNVHILDLYAKLDVVVSNSNGVNSNPSADEIDYTRA